METSKVGVQLLPVCFRKLGAERVEGDVDAPAIRLEFQRLRHDFSCRRSSDLGVRVNPVMEVLEIVLVQGVSNDLNVELIQILVAERALEVRRERGFDQDGVIKLFYVGCNAQHWHCLEPAERVASLQQFAGVSLMQGASDEQRNVVDHVSVGEVLHELGQRAGGVGLNIAKLRHKLVRCFGGECRRRRVRGKGVEEVAICRCKLQLDI